MAEDKTRLIHHLEAKLKVYEAASEAPRYAELAKATKAKLEKLKPKPKPKSAAKKPAKKPAKK
jgi:hypothetical protein